MSLYLKCQLAPGMFPHESIARFNDIEGNMLYAFADNCNVISEEPVTRDSTAWVDGFLNVMFVEVNETTENCLISLRQPALWGSRFYVSPEDLFTIEEVIQWKENLHQSKESSV